jgi:hypothetical protein
MEFGHNWCYQQFLTIKVYGFALRPFPLVEFEHEVEGRHANLEQGRVAHHVGATMAVRWWVGEVTRWCGAMPSFCASIRLLTYVVFSKMSYTLSSHSSWSNHFTSYIVCDICNNHIINECIYAKNYISMQNLKYFIQLMDLGYAGWPFLSMA